MAWPPMTPVTIWTTSCMMRLLFMHVPSSQEPTEVSRHAYETPNIGKVK
jgi:hypothetical protein